MLINFVHFMVTLLPDQTTDRFPNCKAIVSGNIFADGHHIGFADRKRRPRYGGLFLCFYSTMKQFMPLSMTGFGRQCLPNRFYRNETVKLAQGLKMAPGETTTKT
jgi:hypothetical protein